MCGLPLCAGEEWPEASASRGTGLALKTKHGGEAVFQGTEG